MFQSKTGPEPLAVVRTDRTCLGQKRYIIVNTETRDETNMSKKKELDLKKKRKRVVVESESDDDDSEEDLEEVTRPNGPRLKSILC